ncbi:MAG: hypothetical protein LBG72_04450 [Spirochaetaceae bacterium]|jgi:hypothetical protein|nr:hypothetical protein [Spirochaetaceae bacterium]
MARKSLFAIKPVFMAVMTVFALSGCATQALTRYIVDEVGVKNLKKFQYYLSKKVTLETIVPPGKVTVFGDGAGEISRGKIVILESTPGVAESAANNVIRVSFEKGHSNISFRLENEQDLNSDSGYMMDIESIMYDGKKYKVSFNGEGAPRLMIKYYKSGKARIARGRYVN